MSRECGYDIWKEVLQMRNTFNESMRKVGAPLADFWENDLELGLEDMLHKSKADGYMAEWIGNLNGRRAEILCQSLGLNTGKNLQTRRESLSGCNGTLTPYYLVYCFGRNQSHAAIGELAQRQLPLELVQSCLVNDEKFDVTALLFALYHKKPDLLRDVFYLSKIHRKGFARMEMVTQARKPSERSFHDFLLSEDIQSALSKADETLGDGHTSEFRDVIELNDKILVFIRRAERPEHIVHENRIIHGHHPEWIILDFEAGAKRVNIASNSIVESLEIANRLAGGYFGKDVEYRNESQVTYARQLKRLLERLRAQEDEKLTLVELACANTPLDGAPKFKIYNESFIGQGVSHFESAVGGLLDRLNQIESIKVLFAGKRVSVIFAHEEKQAEDEFTVRYSDHRLNAFQRQDFEHYMRQEYGIPILSTEKRFKKQS
jgi:hypothetical protein